MHIRVTHILSAASWETEEGMSLRVVGDKSFGHTHSYVLYTKPFTASYFLSFTQSAIHSKPSLRPSPRSAEVPIIVHFLSTIDGRASDAAICAVDIACGISCLFAKTHTTALRSSSSAMIFINSRRATSIRSLSHESTTNITASCS